MSKAMSAEKFLRDILAANAESMRIGREAALDEAWARIKRQVNATRFSSDYGLGRLHGLKDALDIIKELGGMDPLQRGKQ